MTEKIVQFPEGDDWFVWRDNKGELHRFYKGRYAIMRMPNGTYQDHYISPELGEWEDAVLGFDVEYFEKGGFTGEKIEVKSRKDYEALLERCRQLGIKEAEEKRIAEIFKTKSWDSPEAQEALYAWLRSQEEVANQTNDPRARIELSRAIARIAIYGGYTEEAIEILYLAVEQASQEGLPDLQSRILDDISNIENKE